MKSFKAASREKRQLSKVGFSANFIEVSPDKGNILCQPLRKSYHFIVCSGLNDFCLAGWIVYNVQMATDSSWYRKTLLSIRPLKAAATNKCFLNFSVEAHQFVVVQLLAGTICHVLFCNDSGFDIFVRPLSMGVIVLSS